VVALRRNDDPHLLRLHFTEVSLSVVHFATQKTLSESQAGSVALDRQYVSHKFFPEVHRAASCLGVSDCCVRLR
jgi:hypothetical protein